MSDPTELEQFADRVLEVSTRYNSRNNISYSPANLKGKYSKYPSYGDFPETYTLRGYGKWWQISEANYQKPYGTSGLDPLGAEDFVTVHFNEAVLPSKIYIYETYSPGSIVRIWGRRTKGKWSLLWEGAPQKCQPVARIFQPTLRKVFFFTDTIKLELNCSEQKHHTCLDAVLLTGIPAPDSAFQLKCFERFSLPLVDTSIGDSNDIDSDSKKDHINNLPIEMFMHIFKFLDLQSLTRCARVCRSWNSITKSSLLYKNISLKEYWYTVDSTALDFLQKKCEHLKKLDLSWCGNEDETFSRRFYQFFINSCENLTHLSLGNANYFNGSHLAALGRCPGLIELRLRNVTISELDYCNVESLTKLTNLVTLDLYSSNITNHFLIPLLKSNPNLKYLNLDLCEDIESLDDVIEIVVQYNRNIIGWSSWRAKRLTSRGIRLFGFLSMLEDLDLGWGLPITMQEHPLHGIAHGCRNLRRLIISGWRPLKDCMLMPIIAHCKELEQLDLLSNRGVSYQLIESLLKHLPKLKLLELSYCDSIPMEMVEQWRIKYPYVTIQKCSDTD